MSQDAPPTINDIWSQIEQYYNLEKIFLAQEKLDELEKRLEEDLKSEDPAVVEAAKALSAALEERDARFLIKRVKEESKATREVINLIQTNDGWNLCRSDEGIQTFYRQIPDSPTLSIKIMGVLDCPAFEVLACVNEIDLYKTWIPTVAESAILLPVSDYKRIVHLKMNPPSPISWVVSNREMVLYGYGVDAMEENKLLAIARSVVPSDVEKLREKFEDFATPPETPDRVRMHCHLAGLLFEPMGPTKTRVAVMSNADPKMHLPYGIINMATKNVAHMMFVYLKNQAYNLKTAANGEYAKRINANGGLYDNIRQRLLNPDGVIAHVATSSSASLKVDSHASPAHEEGLKSSESSSSSSSSHPLEQAIESLEIL